MTLPEQIKLIHASYFPKEFHEYRRNLTAAMLNDLAEKIFDNLAPGEVLPDNQEIRAIKRARALVATMKLRDNTPMVR